MLKFYAKVARVDTEIMRDSKVRCMKITKLCFLLASRVQNARRGNSIHDPTTKYIGSHINRVLQSWKCKECSWKWSKAALEETGKHPPESKNE